MEQMSNFIGLTPSQTSSAANLYAADPSSRMDILRSIARVSSFSGEGIVPCEPGFGMSEILFAICMKFPGSSEEAEPILAASFLAKCVRKNRPLPMITEDGEMDFCAKTLVSLAVFLRAMIRRTERSGAPRPEYYRKVAQGILSQKTPAHRALSSHHMAWESFIHENFCTSE
jgi:hypothetical protein